MSDIPEVDPVAAEIHRNFCRKMAPGGKIDQILNGHEPIQKREPLSDAEIALIQKQIEIQLDEYARALNGAVGWYASWKMRRRARGFRCMEGS